jgi:hypothetical protein
MGTQIPSLFAGKYFRDVGTLTTDPSTLINFSSNGPTPLKVGVAFHRDKNC